MHLQKYPECKRVRKLPQQTVDLGSGVLSKYFRQLLSRRLFNPANCAEKFCDPLSTIYILCTTFQKAREMFNAKNQSVTPLGVQ